MVRGTTAWMNGHDSGVEDEESPAPLSPQEMRFRRSEFVNEMSDLLRQDYKQLYQAPFVQVLHCFFKEAHAAFEWDFNRTRSRKRKG